MDYLSEQRILLPGPSRWSKGRWLWLVLLVFAFQVLLLVVLSRQVPGRGGAGESAGSVYWLPEELVEESGRLFPELSDPMLFALNHPAGFLGGAWEVGSRLSYAPTNWTEPARWMGLPSIGLGNELSEYVKETFEPDQPKLAAGNPRLRIPEIEVALVPERTRVWIEGPVAEQWEGDFPELPALGAERILRESVVRVLVDEYGRVLSAVLLRKSGSEEGDALALKTARGLRFRAGGSGVEHGEVVFNWAIRQEAGVVPGLARRSDAD